jgi:hypothetical protein
MLPSRHLSWKHAARDPAPGQFLNTDTDTPIPTWSLLALWRGKAIYRVDGAAGEGWL